MNRIYIKKKKKKKYMQVIFVIDQAVYSFFSLPLFFQQILPVQHDQFTFFFFFFFFFFF